MCEKVVCIGLFLANLENLQTYLKLKEFGTIGGAKSNALKRTVVQIW